MKIEITGTPKEIAALVLAVQERQKDLQADAPANGRSPSTGKLGLTSSTGSARYTL